MNSIHLGLGTLSLAATLGMALLGSSAARGKPEQSAQRAQNVVLVHGGFVDGAGWEGVYSILKKDGYHVSIVQNPTISLEGKRGPSLRLSCVQFGLP